jgi:hypothetical protein
MKIWGTGCASCRCAYRGGNWNNGTNGGVFYLNFNNPRSNSNTNNGGRPALPFAGYVCIALRGYIGAKVKGVCFPPSKNGLGKIKEIAVKTNGWQ